MERRIHIEEHTDYAWKFVAVLQQRDDEDWVELDSWGGDTREEAVETLREECRAARGVEVE